MSGILLHKVFFMYMFVNVHLFVQDSRDELGLIPDKNCNLQEAAARYDVFLGRERCCTSVLKM